MEHPWTSPFLPQVSSKSIYLDVKKQGKGELKYRMSALLGCTLNV